MDWLQLRLITAGMAGTACLILAALSFFRNRSRPINRIFAAFNLFVGLWNLSEIGMALAPTPRMALYIDRLSYVWGTPVAPSFYYLCIEIAEVRKSKVWFDSLVGSIGVFLVIAAFTPWLIADFRTTPVMVEIPGPVFPVFAGYVVVLF